MSGTFLLKVWPVFRCSCMAAFGCSLRAELSASIRQSLTHKFVVGEPKGHCPSRRSCSTRVAHVRLWDLALVAGCSVDGGMGRDSNFRKSSRALAQTSRL